MVRRNNPQNVADWQLLHPLSKTDSVKPVGFESKGEIQQTSLLAHTRHKLQSTKFVWYQHSLCQAPDLLVESSLALRGGVSKKGSQSISALPSHGVCTQLGSQRQRSGGHGGNCAYYSLQVAIFSQVPKFWGSECSESENILLPALARLRFGTVTDLSFINAQPVARLAQDFHQLPFPGGLFRLQEKRF